MDDLIFDTEPLFQVLTVGKGTTVEDDRCRVRILPFESSHTGLLHPEDRDCGENRRFTYLMVERATPTPRLYDDALIIFHGLNETTYSKLFPWAYNLTLRADMPVLIFPMAFHINRRSDAWSFPNQVRRYTVRSQADGNRKASPFNATISERLALSPDRFFRGGLQTYYDVIALCDTIRSGDHPGCHSGTRPHFLGYSAGGYLSLVLMLADPGGRLGESRCIVFASGASLDGVYPASIFIVDTDADDRLMEFYRTRQYVHVGFDPFVAPLTDEPGRWLTEVFFHGPGLAMRLAALRPRLLAVANIRDKVITADGMVRNLDTLDVRQLSLGIHEFPFNIPGPLPDTFDRRHEATKTIIAEARDSHRIGERYRDVFATFIDDVTAFLRA